MEKKFCFTIMVYGTGADKAEAWEDAKNGLMDDFGSADDCVNVEEVA